MGWYYENILNYIQIRYLGPGWSQVQTMLSTLLSIQSLMNSKPYHNEPGYDKERHEGDVEKYNQCIQHETLR